MSTLELNDDQIWVCNDCGGEDVYEAVWMEINGTKGGEPVGDGQSWCGDCDNSHPFCIVITKKEFKEREKEEKALP